MLQDTQPAQLAVEQPPQVLPTNTNNGASTTHRVRITNIHKWVDGTDLAKTFSEQLNLTPYVNYIFFPPILLIYINCT